MLRREPNAVQVPVLRTVRNDSSTGYEKTNPEMDGRWISDANLESIRQVLSISRVQQGALARDAASGQLVAFHHADGMMAGSICLIREATARGICLILRTYTIANDIYMYIVSGGGGSRSP